MVIGLNSSITEKEFFSLMKEYYLSESDEETRELANDIMTHLEPLVEQVSAKFDVTDKEDLKQFCRVKLMLALDKWIPERANTTEGFFRQVCCNAAKDYPKKRTEREFSMLESYDSQERAYILENHSKTLESDWLEEVEVGEEVFLDIYDDDLYNEIYQDCLSMLLENVSCGDSMSSIIRKLSKKYKDESTWRLKGILQNAKITLREHYLDRASKFDAESTLDEMEDSFAFKRLAKYLTPEQVRVILTVFSGCEVKVPSLGGSDVSR